MHANSQVSVSRVFWPHADCGASSEFSDVTLTGELTSRELTLTGELTSREHTLSGERPMGFLTSRKLTSCPC